ncbi:MULTISPECIES: tetratricopeptide repeat protein [unclassified Meiothermus]|uniref:tetratricopeptide repeat protein n=1 Tax=unclassified Meiothermus TaxID=370471 RepID=UPI000D7BD7B6|nr:MULTISPECIES: tetratricopeptide repeat protein [unclassified Meiothermus]PZA07978.1 tetratricopeptide repeat protein [Meiothermus sp. Pnk-1]RYM35337.1 tetratricopeptide repeat protein [Meiothermus sp. PNK-Is4]
MSLVDSAGNPVTAADPAALGYFDQALDDFLHFRGDLVGDIERSIQADPEFALGYACKGYVGVLGTEPADAAAAKAVLAAYLARADLSRLSERERMHLRAAWTLLEGDFHRAGQLLAEISLAYPRDTLALAVGHQIDFFTGNAEMLRDRLAGVMYAWTPEDRHYPNLLGMLSFGLEETGHYQRAEEVGLEAVERNPKDVWGIHAVTHTYEMQGRFAQGMRFMDQRREDWASGNYFILHNWWHYALYALEAGEEERALAIHDTVLLTADNAGVALSLLDATALCWRLYLEGHDLRPRFADQAERWKRKVEPAFYAFNDMHMVMAFVGAGLEREAEELITSRERWLQTHPPEHVSNVRMTREIGLPVCRAILAFGRGQYRRVVELLYPIRRRLHEFGGSHAQRDAVLRTLLEAAIRGGEYALSQALLGERISVKPRSPYNWLKQAQLLERVGESAKAELARKNAARQRLGSVG